MPPDAPSTLGHGTLGTKILASTAVATPFMVVDTLTFMGKVAIAALVAGVVNILLESFRRWWMQRGLPATPPRPGTAPTPAPRPPLTEISGEIPGTPSALDDDLSE